MLLLAALDVLLFLQFPVMFDADRTGLAFDLATVARTAILVALWVMNARALARLQASEKGVFSLLSAYFRGWRGH
jgi:hypothetical protein